MAKKVLLGSIAIFLVLLGAVVSGGWRAQSFGLSGKILVGEFCYAIFTILPIVVLVGLFVVLRKGNSISGARVFVVGACFLVALGVLSVLIAETWCGVEEHVFKRESATRGLGQGQYSRPRRFPYRTCGLVYGNGEFVAHD